MDAENESVMYIPAREDSLDRLMDDKDQQFSDESISVEDEACYSMLRDALYRALDQLNDAERELIQALYFEKKTERQFSDETGVPYMTIHNRKVRILAKLKKLLK